MKVVSKQGIFTIPRSVTKPFMEYIKGNVETTRDWICDFKWHVRKHFRSKGIILTKFHFKR